MDTNGLTPLLVQLDDDLDGLEQELAPLFNSNLGDIAGKLPLLDKAHLYVLITYAIESLLFCTAIIVDKGHLANECSLSPFKWCRCQRAFRLSRIGESQAIFSKD